SARCVSHFSNRKSGSRFVLVRRVDWESGSTRENTTMARLFGLIGNRADLAGRVLGFEADALRVRRGDSQLGWGIGFYQGDEVLMRRRPIDDRDEIDVAKLAADVRADVLVGHVRTATVGSLRTENTHPFRYRQWLFAKTGTLSDFESIRER